MRTPINLAIILLVFSYCTKPLELQSIENPTSENSSLSRLFTDNTGKVFMSWVEEKEETTFLYYSEFDGKDWTEPIVISQSEDWFVNWADYPSLIALDGKPVAAHWLKKIPGNTYSYNVEIASYSDGKFIEPLVPHTDNTATEHGFVSMIPFTDSTFYAIWLDGRNTAGGHGEHGDLSTAMTLRGAELSQSGNILSEAEIDNAICDCCNTSITKTSNGLLAVYRDRTEGEIRDIYVARLTNGEWDDPKPVYNDEWEIAACPVNGPAVDSYNSSVAVAWFTGANNKAVVKLAFSNNEGSSFSTPILIDAEATLGRVDVLLKDENTAWISWMNRNEESGSLQLKLVSMDGEILESYIISEMNPSRGSGFPQITKANNGVLVSWTDYSESGKQIKTAILR
ncbi:MAG: hypothetical protein ACMZ7B_10165 [Balneola sp.]